MLPHTCTCSDISTIDMIGCTPCVISAEKAQQINGSSVPFSPPHPFPPPSRMLFPSPAHLTRSHNSVYVVLNRPFHAKEKERGGGMRASPSSLVCSPSPSLPIVFRHGAHMIMNPNCRPPSPKRTWDNEYQLLPFPPLPLGGRSIP